MQEAEQDQATEAPSAGTKPETIPVATDTTRETSTRPKESPCGEQGIAALSPTLKQVGEAEANDLATQIETASIEELPRGSCGGGPRALRVDLAVARTLTKVTMMPMAPTKSDRPVTKKPGEGDTFLMGSAAP